MTTTTVSPEQLTLLPEPSVPARFHLDEATRRRGLAHVADIRARLDQASEARAASRAGVSPLRRLRLSPDEASTTGTEPVSIAPPAVDTHAA